MGNSQPERQRSGAEAPLRSLFPGPGSGRTGLAAAMDRAPAGGLLAGAVVLALGLAVVDATHAPLLLPLYAVPVGAMAWRFGRSVGQAAAVAVFALAVGADVVASRAGEVSVLMAPARPFLTAWNVLLVGVAFLVVAEAGAAARRLALWARSLARTDPLTGAVDGGAFQELVELEWSRALRYNRPFTLATLDVDRFRLVNELRGRETGDRALRLFVATIRESLRSMDTVARVGGDELAILLPETGEGAAEVVLSKIREQLDDAADTRRLPVSFSIGAVICVGAPQSVERLLGQAEALRDRVKEAGGDGLAVEVLDEPFGIEAILQRS